MQVLGVQRDDQRNSCQESVEKSLWSVTSRPNALTLDEVLAKENISVSGDDQGDQSAFKNYWLLYNNNSLLESCHHPIV